LVKLFNADCYDCLPDVISNVSNPIIVTDPPFNIGYHYRKYKDNLPENVYIDRLKSLLSLAPCVVVHYPEMLYKFSLALGEAPERVVSWVYPSNTGRQHRDIAFWGVKPDFNKVRQPYKNPNDKRIKARMAAGCKGGRLYDWWEINQVKNVSKEKTEHPCQMPIEVMDRVIGILPDDVTIIDPFMGSGTTGVAALKHIHSFVGYEIDEQYFGIAQQRINAFADRRKGDTSGQKKDKSRQHKEGAIRYGEQVQLL
jgi:DNA modification methylase